MNAAELSQNSMIKLYLLGLKGIDALQAIFSLVIRGWLAQVFFMSSLTKIKSWDTTLMVFEYEYSVPLISHVLAAWMATIAELSIPVLLVLGIFTRPAAIALFILILVAMTSYPDISATGTNEHMMWAFMIATLIFYGAGKVSIDYWVSKRFQ